MSEPTGTEHLRALLDERGVEWQDFQHENHTWWFDSNDACWHAENRPTPSGMLVKIDATVTPERAIAVTLGDVDLAAENAKLRELAHLVAEYVSADQCEGCVAKRACNAGKLDMCWIHKAILEKLRELGIEVGL